MLLITTRVNILVHKTVGRYVLTAPVHALSERHSALLSRRQSWLKSSAEGSLRATIRPTSRNSTGVPKYEDRIEKRVTFSEFVFRCVERDPSQSGLAPVMVSKALYL